MDKETLSNYGWIVIAVLVLVVMIALATPFGSFVSKAVQSTTKGLFDVNKSALDNTGLINIDNQEFDVPDMNHGAGENGGNAGETPVVPDEPETPAVTLITFTIDGIEYQAEEGMTWGQWVESEYNIDNYYIDDVYYYIFPSNGNYTVGINNTILYRGVVIESNSEYVLYEYSSNDREESDEYEGNMIVLYFNLADAEDYAIRGQKFFEIEVPENMTWEQFIEGPYDTFFAQTGYNVSIQSGVVYFADHPMQYEGNIGDAKVYATDTIKVMSTSDGYCQYHITTTDDM